MGMHFKNGTLERHVHCFVKGFYNCIKPLNLGYQGSSGRSTISSVVLTHKKALTTLKG